MVQTKTAKNAGRRVNGKHVKELLAEYKQMRWVHNSDRIGKADSLSVWYGIDELQDFINTARQSGANGIKMYFGVYSKENASDIKYEGRQTIVLVASKTGIQADGSSIEKSVFHGGELVAFNFGRLCPPNCTNTDSETNDSGFDIDNPGILIDRKDGGMIVV